MEQILNYIKPELLVLVPVLYFIGAGLKKSAYIPDRHIPVLLGAVAVILAFLWVWATSVIATAQGWALAVFTAIVQGVLVAGCSVYVNQIVKQSKKAE